MLSKVIIAQKISRDTKVVAIKTETEAEWVRRRLKEEADDFSEFASHSARIKALELIGKINGVFEADNAQARGVVFVGKVELVAPRTINSAD